MTHEKCPDCPVAGPGCEGLRTRRLCELAGTRDDYRRRLCELAGEAYAPPPAPGGIRPVPRGHRPRVGFLTPVLYQGGTEEWHRQLLFHADPAKVAVTGLVVTEYGAHTPATLALFADRLPAGEGPGSAQALADTSDVLVTWGSADLSRLRIPRGVRVVGVSHGDEDSEWTRDCLRALGPYVTDWVGVSGTAHRPPGAHMTVIENGCDAARLAPSRPRREVRGSLGVADTDRLLIHVGRLSEGDKRVTTLARAAGALGAGYHLLLVGSGPDGDRILADAASAAPGRFSHVPWTLAIGDYLRAADAGVLVSRTEGFAIVLAEYLAAGLPALSTPVGLAALRPEFFGALPADGTPGEYARLIAADFDDPGRDARTAAGRAEVLARYSVPAFVSRWESYLAALCPAPGVPTRAEVDAVKRCPDRECPDGCVMSRCRAGRSPRPGGAVSLHDCLACPALPGPGTP